MWKKVACLFLILSFIITIVGCGGVPTAPPISSESEFVLVQVTDPKSNLISVAGEENEDAIAILGEKDIEGNPTGITGVVYVFEQGDSFGIDAGIDGLPTYLIDSEGNKVLFENYTNSTVDISIYNSSGSLIQDTTTINIDPADLLELKQLYNSFYSQKKGWDKNVADDVKAVEKKPASKNETDDTKTANKKAASKKKVTKKKKTTKKATAKSEAKAKTDNPEKD